MYKKLLYAITNSTEIDYDNTGRASDTANMATKFDDNDTANDNEVSYF